MDDISDSDDSYLCYRPGLVLSSSEALIWLIFDGAIPYQTPNSLSFNIESRADTVGTTYTVEFYNWITEQYEEIASQQESFDNDASGSYSATFGIADYVQAGTGKVRTRVGWRQTGIVLLFPWTVCIDQVSWTTN